MNTFFQKIIYIVLKGISHLPLRVLYIIADILRPIIYSVVKYRRSVVHENLRNSFPSKSQEERARIERGFYKFFCDYAVETIKLLSISKEEMKRRMVIDGIEEMMQSFKKEDLCFVYLGHYGNWEWMSSLGLWVPEEVKCAQIYRPLRNQFSDQLFLEMRSRFNSTNISKYKALRAIVDFKKRHQKTIIGFISDQSPRPINIHDWINFLHQDTGVYTGTERIAKKVGASIYFADIKHTKRGYYHCHFRKITDDATTFKDFTLTEHYMQLMEEMIHRDPTIWLWSHKRWKYKKGQTS